MEPRRVRALGAEHRRRPQLRRAVREHRAGRSRQGVADPNGGVHAMLIEIPEFALVLLVGASGTGKSTFAAKHFLPTEVVSSDRARGWVADDETDQSATGDAFDIVDALIEKRLKN